MTPTIDTQDCAGCVYQGGDNRCHRYPGVLERPGHLDANGHWNYAEWARPWAGPRCGEFRQAPCDDGNPCTDSEAPR